MVDITDCGFNKQLDPRKFRWILNSWNLPTPLAAKEAASPGRFDGVRVLLHLRTVVAPLDVSVVSATDWRLRFGACLEFQCIQRQGHNDQRQQRAEQGLAFHRDAIVDQHSHDEG